MSERNFSELDLPFEERWENLTIANDFLFGKVFQDLELCLELVQIILPELNIKKISFPELQKSVKETFDTRGVRFDVYLHDEENRIINIEMQPVKRDNLMKRARAYHSMLNLDAMDMRNVKRYDDMPESIVIFICDFDLFNLQRHIYTFKNFCVQEPALALNDGTSTIFLNAKGKADDVSPRLKAFLDLVSGKTSDDSFVKKIEQKIAVLKQNLYWRQDYMLAKFERYANIEEGRDIGLAEGRAKGRAEGRAESSLEIARRMRKAGIDDGQIHLFTDLSIEEIKKL